LKPKSKKKNLYYIEWEDAYSNSGWFSDEEIRKWEKDRCIVREVGWILERTKRNIIIASRLAPNEEKRWGMLQMIPKTWIKKIIKLRVAN